MSTASYSKEEFDFSCPLHMTSRDRQKLLGHTTLEDLQGNRIMVNRSFQDFSANEGFLKAIRKTLRALLENGKVITNCI